MCEFVPGTASPREDVTRRGWTSPDRMDALVWACHELFLKDAVPDYSMFTSAVNVFAGLPPSYFRKPWEW
jgi:hypothetical protein